MGATAGINRSSRPRRVVRKLPANFGIPAPLRPVDRSSGLVVKGLTRPPRRNPISINNQFGNGET